MGFFDDLIDAITRPFRPRKKKPSPKIEPIENKVKPIENYTAGIQSDSTDTSVRDNNLWNEVPAIGPFTFPSPYNTQACRLTNSGKVASVGYSYWRQINAHERQDYLQVVLSIDGTLRLITMNKQFMSIGEHIDLGINHSGEGLFFSRKDENIIYLPEGNKLLKFNVRTFEREFIFGIQQDEILWQVHSDYNENLFSGSAKDSSNYRIKNWVVGDKYSVRRFEVEGEPDECQIDKSGTWLQIKEDNYNKFVNIHTKETILLANEAGALGHSDAGFSFFIGEDDHNVKPGALVKIDLPSLQQKLLYHTDYWNLGHVSFTNSGLDTRNENCLISPSGDYHSRGRELVLVKLDGSHRALILCPAMTQEYTYDNMPKASLDCYGQFAIWTAFINGRRDAFIVKVPSF